jgi:hypothetical protein
MPKAHARNRNFPPLDVTPLGEVKELYRAQRRVAEGRGWHLKSTASVMQK